MSIRTVRKFFELWTDVERTANDPKYKQMIQDYHTTNLTIGWKVFVNTIISITLFGVTFMLVTSDRSSPGFMSILITRPLVLIIVLSLDRLFVKYQIIRENVIPLIWLTMGFLFTFENTREKEPKFYDIWHNYHFMAFFIAIVHCLRWKKVVV